MLEDAKSAFPHHLDMVKEKAAVPDTASSNSQDALSSLRAVFESYFARVKKS